MKIRTRINSTDVVRTARVSAIYFMDLAIKKLQYGKNVLWEIVSSCFGSGIWIEAYNWSETDNWKE